jgi:predicted amidohydrolase YtcJ
MEKNRVKAIAIRDSVIISSGTKEAAKGLIGPETVVVDLKGKTLTPPDGLKVRGT